MTEWAITGAIFNGAMFAFAALVAAGWCLTIARAETRSRRIPFGIGAAAFYGIAGVLLTSVVAGAATGWEAA